MSWCCHLRTATLWVRGLTSGSTILTADGTHTSHVLEGKKPSSCPLPPAPPHLLPQPGGRATCSSLTPAADLPGVTGSGRHSPALRGPQADQTRGAPRQARCQAAALRKARGALKQPEVQGRRPGQTLIRRPRMNGVIRATEEGRCSIIRGSEPGR